MDNLTMNDALHFAHLSHHISDKKIWVIGDIIVDGYIDGQVSRISPEAPVPVMNVENEYMCLGGAANVAHQIARLGGFPVLCGTVGNDSISMSFDSACMEKQIGTYCVRHSSKRPTTHKVRVLAHNRHVIRMDWEDTSPITIQEANELLDLLNDSPDPDAVIISDYCKGVITPYMAASIIEKVQEIEQTFHKVIPILIDTKSKHIGHFKGATLFAPNLKELCNITEINIDPDDDDQIMYASKKITEETNANNILTTLSEHGMKLWDNCSQQLTCLPAESCNACDVTGAGDVVIALVAAAQACNIPLEDAIKLANTGASVAVSKLGTYVVSLEDINNKISKSNHVRDQSIYNLDDLSEDFFEYLHSSQDNICFTNGCFDILHPGHISILKQAKELGDFLVVGLNSDDSIKQFKGASRPINNEQYRADVLSSLSFVDMVIIFNETTPESLIQKIKPHTLVKGSDYKDKFIVGKEFVMKNGGCVVLFDNLPEYSTTSVIKKIQARI